MKTGRKKGNSENVLVRLLRHCDGDVSNPQEHWPWIGTIKGDGYGIFMTHGGTKCTTAHRAMFEATQKIKVPRKLDVAHRPEFKCPRNCVNPNHLYIATRKQNIKDSVDAKTHYFPYKTVPAEVKAVILKEHIPRHSNGLELSKEFGVALSTLRNIASGFTRKTNVKSGHSVLTWKQVKDIRRRYKASEGNLKELAKKYNVTGSAICKWVKDALQS